MTQESEAYRRDMMASGGDDHPLAEEIKRLAADHEIDLTDIRSLAKVLDMIEGAENSDARLLLICALLLEQVTHHDQQLSMERLLSGEHDDTAYMNSEE